MGMVYFSIHHMTSAQPIQDQQELGYLQVTDECEIYVCRPRNTRWANGDDQILHPRPGFSTDASTKDSSQDFVADFFLQ